MLQLIDIIMPIKKTSNIEENFKYIEVTATSKKINVPKLEQLKKALDSISNRDKFNLCIGINGVDDIHVREKSNLPKITEELQELLEEIESDQEFELKLTIDKNIKDNKLSIYSYTTFMNFLNNFCMEMNSFLEAISIYLSKGYIIFESLQPINEFYTNNIYFLNKDSSIDINYTENRNTYHEKRNEICSYLNASEYKLIPQDFYLIERSNDEQFNSIFDRLLIIFSLIYIVNISSMKKEDKLFYYKLNGYKTIAKSIYYQKINNTNSELYYKIYRWIYTDGNLSDKVGIARNIISLHITNNDLFTLEKDTLDSIKSSYEIYLKENVTQYLQLRATINQSLNEYLLKTEKIVDNFISIFYKYLIGIVTFIISVIVMNCVYAGKGNLIKIVTGDIGIIATGLLIASIIGIKFIIRPEISKKFNRYEFQYKKLKESYEKLLNKEDLDDIFNDEIYLLKNRNDIEESICKYSKVWDIIILILVASIIIA